MSGIRLVPQGTNLYVRNYETFHSWNDDRQNAVPLIATPQKLDDAPGFKQSLGESTLHSAP